MYRSNRAPCWRRSCSVTYRGVQKSWICSNNIAVICVSQMVESDHPASYMKRFETVLAFKNVRHRSSFHARNILWRLQFSLTLLWVTGFLRGPTVGKCGVRFRSDCRFRCSKASDLFLNQCVGACLWIRAHLCLWLVNMPKSTENANLYSNVSNELAVSVPDMQDLGPKEKSHVGRLLYIFFGRFRAGWIYYSWNPKDFPLCIFSFFSCVVAISQRTHTAMLALTAQY